MFLFIREVTPPPPMQATQSPPRVTPYQENYCARCFDIDGVRSIVLHCEFTIKIPTGNVLIMGCDPVGVYYFFDMFILMFPQYYPIDMVRLTNLDLSAEKWNKNNTNTCIELLKRIGVLVLLTRVYFGNHASLCNT